MEHWDFAWFYIIMSRARKDVMLNPLFTLHHLHGQLVHHLCLFLAGWPVHCNHFDFIKTLIIKLGGVGRKEFSGKKIGAKRLYALWPMNKMNRKNLEERNLLEAMISSCYFASRTNMLIHKLQIILRHTKKFLMCFKTTHS